MIVRKLFAGDAPRCDEIVASLPEFFGHEGGLAACREAVRSSRGWVVADGDDVYGFLTVGPMSPNTVEVTWMAVRADQRDRGYGAMLLTHVVDIVRDEGADALALYTSASDTYAPTRAFYRAQGLVAVGEVVPEGWDEPGVLMVRTF